MPRVSAGGLNFKLTRKYHKHPEAPRRDRDELPPRITDVVRHPWFLVTKAPWSTALRRIPQFF
jgi:hypothetical protein